MIVLGAPIRMDWSNLLTSALFKKDSKIRVHSRQELDSLLHQARENKVLARVLPRIEVSLPSLTEVLESARSDATNRLQDALRLLSETQTLCIESDIPFAVIKSLDALPDIGHDIDLLVGKNVRNVKSKLLRRFKCTPVTLTFCDRQAGKFSTFINGFGSDFELYAMFSQLGEQYYPEEEVLKRRLWAPQVNGGTFIPSVEDRLLITCIHTMYRHGKIRLSDLNIARESFKSHLDLPYILERVESSGIRAAFVVFITLLEKITKETLGQEIVPKPVKSYLEKILSNDRLLAVMVRRLKTTVPFRVPVGIAIILFLHKSLMDMSHSRLQSSFRCLVAPVLFVMYKLIPLRLQKAMAIRIW